MSRRAAFMAAAAFLSFACDDDEIPGVIDVGEDVGAVDVTPPGPDAAPPPDGTATPQLLGIEADKPMTLELGVQAAYNDDTIFYRLTWRGTRGDRHDYWHFTNGQWQHEGHVRRDSQATIDNDPIAGETDAHSTIYESRTAFMLSDPSAPNAVPDFEKFGCMKACHDNSRHMPLWKSADGETGKYFDAGMADLWHARNHRGGLIWRSDDQQVTTFDASRNTGRLNDQGDGPFQTLELAEGHPPFVFDPATSGGLFAAPWESLLVTPLYYFTTLAAAELGPRSPNPVALAWDDAVALGYVPTEGDVVPGRLLRIPTGSHGDITMTGTAFTPISGDELGTWSVELQRRLDTGNPDDVALAEGRVFHIAFAVHDRLVTTRDHWVSFPLSHALGAPADLQAVKIAGSGAQPLPDWEAATVLPPITVVLFLPGITSWEFLTGQAPGSPIIGKETGLPIGQTHAGAAGMAGGLSCATCHTVAKSEPKTGSRTAGSMEELVPRRSGVFGPTPHP